MSNSVADRTGYSASIYPQLNFTNIGSRIGTIETLKLELVTEEGFILEFVPYIDNMTLSYLQEDNNIPSAYESPLQPFAIAPGASATKSILFVNSNGFNFIPATYLLKVLYNLSGGEEFQLCSQRHIRLNQNIAPDQWLVSVDPLGTEEFFDFPQRIRPRPIRIILNP